MAAVTLVLFDIDGTLLRAGGAGRAAMNDAFEGCFGVADGFQSVSFAGSVDPKIVREACHTAGVTLDADRLPFFQSLYVSALRARLDEAGEACTLLPGVPAVLDDVEELARCALLTGNWRIGARVKLERFELWSRFAFGAYGDDGLVRDELVPVARRRAKEHGLEVGRVVVIGDTPADVQCARAGAAEAVAVKTGWSTPEELAAAGPDLLLDDLLSGREALLRFLA